MRVLITGAPGFVGRHLVARCRSEGAHVVGLARRPPARDLALDGYLAVDLRDPAATAAAVRDARPDRVFHLAAQASVGEAWRDPRGTVTNNVASSHNLLEAVRAEAPRARVLVAVSGEIYGPVADEQLPVTEEAPLRPQNPYAVSKAAVDLLAGLYADVLAIATVRTRAFNHTGPGQSDAYVVAAFAKQIAAAEARGADAVTIETGNVEPRRDFTDVRDVVRAYWLALEHGDPGPFNVCSGNATSVADILQRLAGQTGLEVTQRTDPARVREHEVMEIRGSHDKLTSATGWEPEVPLDETLRDTLDWWRQNVREEAVT